jgi:hypothetical protein
MAKLTRGGEGVGAAPARREVTPQRSAHAEHAASNATDPGVPPIGGEKLVNGGMAGLRRDQVRRGAPQKDAAVPTLPERRRLLPAVSGRVQAELMGC